MVINMTKFMKKLLLSIFVLFCFSAIGKNPSRCQAATKFDYDSSMHTLEIYSTNEKGEAMPDYYSVGSAPWERYSGQVSTVIIKSSINSIGAYAFYNMFSLQSVVFEGAIKSIGEGAFMNTGVNELSWDANGSQKLTIQRQAFQFCNNLSTVIFPASVSIGDYAFASCGYLSTAEKNGSSDGNTSIGAYAFYNCRLQSINWANDIKSIGENAFEGNRNLTAFSFGKKITSIGRNAFYDCGLSEITLPDTLTSIGDYAFYHNPYATKLSVYSKNASISSTAFERCDIVDVYCYSNSTTHTLFKESNATIHLLDGSSQSDDSSVTGQKLKLGGFIYTVDAEKNATLVECTSRGDIVIPEYLGEYKLTKIGDYIFDTNSSITSIRIPATVKEIGTGFCYACENLKRVFFYGPVDKIGICCFYGCYNLEYVFIPKVNVSIGMGSLSELYHGKMIYTTDKTPFLASNIKTPVTEYSSDYTLSDFNFSKNTVQSVYKKESVTPTVIIPGKFGWFSVNTLGDQSFANQNTLETVAITTGLQNLGAGVFQNCSNLKNVVLPSTLQSIGSNAFAGGSITGERNYYYTGTGIDFGNLKTNKPFNLFVKGSSLGSFDLSSIKALKCSIFSYIIHEDGTASITDAYNNKSSLTLDCIYELDDNNNLRAYPITSLPENCLKGNKMLYSIILPKKLKVIPKNAFSYCSNLSNVQFGTKVTSIGNLAFAYCDRLTEIALPASVTTIGISAFANNTSSGKEKTIYCNGTMSDYSSFTYCKPFNLYIPGAYLKSQDTSFASNYECTIMSYQLKTDGTAAVTDIYQNKKIFKSSYVRVVNENQTDKKYYITSLPAGAFMNKSILTEVYLPQKLTSVPNNLCKNSYNLKLLEIGGDVTSIGSSSFENCNNLTTIYARVGLDKLQSIGDNAFFYTGITDTSIFEHATKLGNSAFGCCKMLTYCMPTKMESVGTGVFFNASIEKVSWSAAATTVPVSMFYQSSLKEITLPEGVTKISSQSFGRCSDLYCVVIPNSVKEIETNAFVESSNVVVYTTNTYATNYCKTNGIKCVNPSTVAKNFTTTTLSDGTLEITSYLGNDKEVIVPCTINGVKVTSIGTKAFYYKAVTSVILPGTLTKICDHAFSYSGITSIVIPKGVVSIGKSVFACTNLATISLPSTLKTLGSDVFALTALKRLVIPSSVTAIPDYMCYGCGGLTSVTLPKSITTIGNTAFSNCSSLTSLYIKNVTTSIGKNAFYNCAKLTISSPCALVQKYCSDNKITFTLTSN